MNHEALILRRCYPVPVTFADMRAAYSVAEYRASVRVPPDCRHHWPHALKQVTSAIDEVYAVVDGREVRVAVVDKDRIQFGSGPEKFLDLLNLLEIADEQDYWERPHEVRLDLSPRPVTHGEVARAVMVGQESMERGGVVRS